MQKILTQAGVVGPSASPAMKTKLLGALESSAGTIYAVLGSRCCRNVIFADTEKTIKQYLELQFQRTGKEKLSMTREVADGLRRHAGMSHKRIGETLSIKPQTSRVYYCKKNNTPRAQPVQGQMKTKYVKGVTRDKSFPGELDTLHEHAKSFMYVPSGSASDVYLLAENLVDVYLDYRKNYADLLSKMEDSAGCGGDNGYSGDDETETAKRDHLHAQNLKLVRQGCKEVEPWSTQVTAMKHWVGKRKAAGLPTAASSAIVVNNANRLEVILLKAPDSPAKPPQDYQSCATLMQANLERSRRDADQLRPRSYRTWRGLLRRIPNFTWRRINQHYSCDICDEAPQTEAKWCEVNQLLKKEPSKTPQWMKLHAERYKVLKKMSRLERHQRQLGNQRAYLQKLERNLPRKTEGCFHVVVYTVPSATSAWCL